MPAAESPSLRTTRRSCLVLVTLLALMPFAAVALSGPRLNVSTTAVADLPRDVDSLTHEAARRVTAAIDVPALRDRIVRDSVATLVSADIPAEDRAAMEDALERAFAAAPLESSIADYLARDPGLAGLEQSRESSEASWPRYAAFGVESRAVLDADTNQPAWRLRDAVRDPDAEARRALIVFEALLRGASSVLPESKRFAEADIVWAVERQAAHTAQLVATRHLGAPSPGADSAPDDEMALLRAHACDAIDAALRDAAWRAGELLVANLDPR